MNEVLHDLYAHNAWATRTLIDTCRNLTEEQLKSSTTGAYGHIHGTLEHLVYVEANYYRLATGEDLYDPDTETAMHSLDEISEMATVLESRWKTFLESPIDIDRTVRGADDDGNRYDIALGVVLAQIFNHANVHREQICSILTSLSVDFPEIDGWSYSAASGRARLVVEQETD